MANEFNTTGDNGSGRIRRVRRTLFEGKPNEQKVVCGETLVRADARFTSTITTPFGGTDDAKEARALAKGEAPPPKHYDVKADYYKRSQRVLKAKMDARRAEIGAEVVLPPNPPAELAAKLAAFEDDPEMQLQILKRYQKTQAERKANESALPLAEPAVS